MSQIISRLGRVQPVDRIRTTTPPEEYKAVPRLNVDGKTFQDLLEEAVETLRARKTRTDPHRPPEST